LILSFETPKGGVGPWVQGIAAASVAVAAGFRIQFVTNPAGGYLYLHALAIPLTILWVLVILRLREGLRQVAPRPAWQFAIDLILSLNAVFLVLISPQARVDSLAYALPLVILGAAFLGNIISLRKGCSTIIHRSIAFGLALYAIGGVMKMPLSLSLVMPLAALSLPMMTASQALLAQGVRRLSPRPLPRWFVAHGYTQGAFTLLALLLSSVLSLGAVLSVTQSLSHGLLSLLIVPVLVGIHVLRPIVSNWYQSLSIDARGGRSYLCGVGFDNLTLDEAKDRALDMLHDSSRTHVIVTPNSVSLFNARKYPALLDAYCKADLVIADGIGIVWAARLLGVPLAERVTGIDLTEALLGQASADGYRVFLLGGQDGVAVRAAHRLQKRFPGLDIVGTHHGYFTDDENLLARITAAQPQIILVGMGVPKQERWMTRYANKLNVPVMIGLGGGLDIFAGDSLRASSRWQRLGLEWLYRILHQPRRVKAAWTILCFIVKMISLWTVLFLAQAHLAQPREQPSREHI
jgi:N-acetylglucosaminyldiphosphoundecaprenol N-acetyl-beta-D-mannosaminyltransferase